jgi:hypothetical protein
MHKSQFAWFSQDLEGGDATPVEATYDSVVTRKIQLLGSVTINKDFRTERPGRRETKYGAHSRG